MNPAFCLLILSMCMLPIHAMHGQWSSLGHPGKAVKIISNIPVHDQIEVDAEGNVFLLGTEKGLLYKYLANQKYDSAIFAGGISTRADGFLHPKKLALKNRQDFYLLDDLGRKIVLFDKELKVLKSSDFFAISSNSGVGIPDEFEPQSFDISTSGETFVLNKTNNRVYKINAFGNIESVFGGLDYGVGSLYAPEDIQVSPDNRIYVSDPENQEIKVFDLFGTYQQTYRLPGNWIWNKFHVNNALLLLWNEGQFYVINLLSGKNQEYQVPNSAKFHDVYIGREIIYLLLENEVHLYPIKE